MLADGPPSDESWSQWNRGFLFSPALTVGGGTSEVLRNIIHRTEKPKKDSSNS